MKRILSRIVVAGFCGIFILSSCRKEEKSAGNTPQQQIADNFNYSTTSEVEIDLRILDKAGDPLQGVRFDIRTSDLDKHIASGASDANGYFSGKIRIPAYLTDVAVVVQRVGIDKQVLNVENGSVSAVFGGPDPGRNKWKILAGDTIPAGGNWFYLGTHNSDGVPNYLEVPGDVVDPQFISDISATLPEAFNIPTNKPNLLAASNDFDIHMVATGDVWITYVAEGAGQKNTFGYFVYDASNPPATVADIDTIFTVFPNSSNAGSGGGLQSGDKVYLGKFNAGESIGWVLLSNGWDDDNDVIKATSTLDRLYSLEHLNTFASNPAKRRHNVQLVDRSRELIVVGFEDIRRDFGGDEDFNDILFYTTVVPFSAAFTDNIAETDHCAQDDDNDGINNCAEDYRFDPERAFDNVVEGTLAFEDLWPGQGDYDFNDLVIDYSTNYVTNASNLVKDIKTELTIRAVGGSTRNGFGIEIEGLSPADVASVTGYNISSSMISLQNGLESGQSNAVVIPFDRVFDLIEPVPGDYFVNTIVSENQLAPVTMQVDITLYNPQSTSDIGLPPYNPFMFVDSTRGREIHLADMHPTDLADPTYFGTFEDDSDQLTKYYKSDQNLPWAIHIDGSFDYPIEKVNITEAYLNFTAWASSGGMIYPDWYLDQSGNRDDSKIY